MNYNVIVRQYISEYYKEWDDFVDASNNGTMFHKQAFLDYHVEGKFTFHHLMFYYGKELVGVLPCGLTNQNTTLWSPMGASYGSFVTKDIPFALSLAIVDALLEYGREIGLKEIFLIPPPLVYNKILSQHLEYAMLYRKFDFELHYISHALPITGDDATKQFDKKAQRDIRNIIAKNNLRVEESDDYESFYAILLDNKRRHNATPTHSLEDLYRLRKLVPQHLRLILIYLDDKPIAGSLVFLCNSSVALCFYNMLLHEYSHLRPVFLMMHNIVSWAQQHDYKWVDIGVSQVPTAADPMTPSLSLIEFKERFNTRGFIRNTYHFSFTEHISES
jgi:lipid II:glycine glycyltransferase (peptidoglycan interpeptide bridge formation enzyme)